MTELAPGATCMALILEAATAHAESDAIVLPGDRVTYHGLVAGATEWARAFIALGVSKGEHVGVLLPNGTQFMHVLFGAMLAGAVPVPINTRYRGPEIAAMLADADLVTVVSANEVEQQPNLVDRLYEALPDLPAAAVPERLSLAQAPRLRNIIVGSGHIHPRRHGLFGRNRYAALLARRSAAAHRTGQQ